ncbi:MAG: hypothetical protein WCP69_09555 [Bacteroidota bacterium]
MNEFYSICKEDADPENEYQMQNLGKQTIMAVIGKQVRGDWGESRSCQSQTFYKDTVPEDYDDAFVLKLTSVKPPYDLYKVLDYHLSYYINTNHGDKDRFLKQIKYVILPIIQKRKSLDVYMELITEWIKKNDMNTKNNKTADITLNIGDINAPTQFQLNSDNSSQSQEIYYNKEDIKELFELLKKDIEKINEEFKEEFQYEIESAIKQLNKGKDIRNRLFTIGSLIKEVGINLFANLLASPIYSLMKPFLGIK